MTNLVLYRKYRPKLFSQMIGQEHIIKALTNEISSETVSHAYLFTGPRGSGKTTLARLLAKAVNCENRKKGDYEPCNECFSCLEINKGKAIDLIEIDAASNRGIDDVRSLKEGIEFAPTKFKYKVIIIDECHQLSKDAANALLKTLEEPPSHVLFVLATTESNKMIPTIISRCQRFDFKMLNMKEIIEKLNIICKNEKAKIEESSLELIAANSGGSIRDAESMLDQVLGYGAVLGKEKISKDDVNNLLGLIDFQSVSQLIDFLIQKKAKEAIECLNETLEKGKDPQQFAKSLISYLREILVLKIGSDMLDGFTKEEKEKIKAQTEKFSEENIKTILKLFMEAENEMRYSSIPQLPIELAITEYCGIV